MQLSKFPASIILAALLQANLRGNGRLLHSSSSSKDYSVQLGAGQCEVCSKQNKNKPDSLTFEITNKEGFTQSIAVQAGSVFTIDGPFDANSYFQFQQGGSCSIHTSCSAPLVTGDQLGPFKLLQGNDCSVGSSSSSSSGTPASGEPCEICSKQNKIRPDRLTIQYKANGVNSLYQDSSKASCVAGMYPTETNLVMSNKNNVPQAFAVRDGSTFTIEGPFDAETDFLFSDGSECFIHTSCSVPLVTGDQIGPFVILEGNDCKFATPAPTNSPTTASPSKSPTKAPTTARPSKSPTLPPSPAPSASPVAPPTPPPVLPPVLPPAVSANIVPAITPDPTAGPTPGPTPGPTSGPTPDPTPAPTSGPTPGPTSGPTPGPTPDPTPASTTPCVSTDKFAYQCGEPISVSFHFDDPLENDWIGIYPCDETQFFHSEVWQWTCPGFPGNCTAPVGSSNDLVFDHLPSYNSFGPYTWPVAPYNSISGDVNRCFKAVLLRNDGPSVPPYVDICERESFTITENDQDGCAIRATSISDVP